MITGDTITAISSAVGASARMIVRLSGPDSHRLTRALCPDADLLPGTASPARLRLCGFAVPITLYSFHAPRSYTGEDLIEFHLPGNPLLCRMLLEQLIVAGARAAEAGEFTARAYFNGKLDLTAAEGVAATIAAHGDAELRAARQLSAGELARRLKPLMDSIADTLAFVEVGIDFVEEDVSFLTASEVKRRVMEADVAVCDIIDHSARFDRLAHEPRVVLVGRPNAGKSTLLNALAGRDRAVVSAVAGTTRDALRAEVVLRRGLIQMVDVAGLDESESPAGGPQGEIDTQMQTTARRELESADLVVLVHDATSALPPLILPRPEDLIVNTKSDLHGSSTGLHVSAVTGHNLELLRHHLDQLAFGSHPPDASLALNLRHLHALTDARTALSRAVISIEHGPELAALDLREALNALGAVLGTITPDDLLGRIFSAFCIGK